MTRQSLNMLDLVHIAVEFLIFGEVVESWFLCEKFENYSMRSDGR